MLNIFKQKITRHCETRGFGLNEVSPPKQSPSFECSLNRFRIKCGMTECCGKAAAFTLAEVLITLGVIGVVAAMTIPTLITNYQKTQYVTQLKKIYTQFNQVLMQMSIDKGCTNNLACTGVFDVDKDNLAVGSEIIKYFKITKDCKTDINECMPDNVSDYYDGSGTRYNYKSSDDYEFITVDGVSYAIWSYQENCKDYGGTRITRAVCADMAVDINGPSKGPNAYGRDLFMFSIINTKGPQIYPEGGSLGGSNNWKNPSGTPQSCIDTSREGWGCAGRILEEDWQMKY